MTWSTHCLFGIGCLWLLTPFTSPTLEPNIGILAAVAMIGALLPDLDASESKIKHLKLLGTSIKPFALPALIVSKTDQHRGLLHSLAGMLMVGVFAAPIIPSVGWNGEVAFLLGYMSHLVADSATKTGVRLWYPSKRKYFLLGARWRFTTGSQVEEMLLAPLALSAFLLLLSAEF